MKKSELIKIIESVITELDDSGYEKGSPIKSSDLKAGDIVFCGYRGHADVCKFLGFSDDSKTYGDGGVKFKTLREVFSHYKIKSIPELQAYNDKVGKEKGYGYGVYMLFDEMGERNVEFTAYLFKGRWSLGSSADRMNLFKAVKK